MIMNLLVRFKMWLESLKIGREGRKEKELHDMLSQGTGRNSGKYF